MPSTKAAQDAVALRKPYDDEVDMYGLTHQGKIRQSNQDHFLICSVRKQIQVHRTSLPDVERLPLAGERMAFIAVVADGVGGGTKGETASRLALERVTEYVALTMRAYHDLDATDDQPFMEALQEAAWKCHASVVAEAEADSDRRGMATTMTLWLAVWPRAYLLQVGDSRFYTFRDDKLTRISRDQTMAQELVDQGVLTSATAMNTKWANVLSSSIGGQQTAPVVTRLDQDWANVSLLCSDGLTKHVSDERIAERIRGMTSAQQVCENLLQDALDDGGSDNISIIVVRDVKKSE
ncbi:MAG: protein phosphatase 2C domain-containing protein [Gemmatimonadota bacterium]|nr:protein phosphatase 2C domain-containing protein [Gemmatimonadota bacterium]MDH5198698.1 protein phosphatase 2C domain-containing protein [Gemmatimonadota bacterium]